jgi:large subunit ribosomal protein L11
MKVKLIVDGGSMKPGPAVAQQLGPMGINLGKVIEDVNKATTAFKGVKVPVELDVDPKTKKYEILVFSPPVAEMIKKELGLEKGSGEAGTTLVGNMAFETALKVALTKQVNLPTTGLKASVKLVVGTCVSMGVLIDSKNPKEIMRDIENGKYDREIKNEITEASVEKKKELDAYFGKVKSEQEKKKKAAEEAKAAAEAAKLAAEQAAVAAGTAPAAAAATPAAGKAAAGATAAEPAKAEAGKKDAKKK